MNTRCSSSESSPENVKTNALSKGATKPDPNDWDTPFDDEGKSLQALCENDSDSGAAAADAAAEWDDRFRFRAQRSRPTANSTPRRSFGSTRYLYDQFDREGGADGADASEGLTSGNRVHVWGRGPTGTSTRISFRFSTSLRSFQHTDIQLQFSTYNIQLNFSKFFVDS